MKQIQFKLNINRPIMIQFFSTGFFLPLHWAHCSSGFANNNTVAVRYHTSRKKDLFFFFRLSCACVKALRVCNICDVYKCMCVCLSKYTPPLLLHCYSACNFYLFIIIITIVRSFWFLFSLQLYVCGFIVSFNRIPIMYYLVEWFEESKAERGK